MTEETVKTLSRQYFPLEIQQALLRRQNTFSHQTYAMSLCQGKIATTKLFLPGINRTLADSPNDILQFRTLKQISGLNFRIARAMPGAADQILEQILADGSLHNVLLLSPPGCGKNLSQHGPSPAALQAQT